jgi:hypothetical protein
MGKYKFLNNSDNIYRKMYYDVKTWYGNNSVFEVIEEKYGIKTVTVNTLIDIDEDELVVSDVPVKVKFRFVNNKEIEIISIEERGGER